jgi:GMP synthase (glutamine-hydrolysing)
MGDSHVHAQSITILDFGGQYAHLIANRIRRLGVFSEIHEAETPASALRDAAGIILSGGPQSVYEAGSPQADPAILELGIPVLGICYGHQWIAHALGGEVKPGKAKEYGAAEITQAVSGERRAMSILLNGLPRKLQVWMSHGDTVVKLPEGFQVTASSPDCSIAAMEDTKRKIFGTQFHLEVTHTPQGMEILKRFVDLCDHAPWSVEDFTAHIGAQIEKEVGDRKIFLLVSGGVDSTVAFTLLCKVLSPDRVRGLLIDTGLMRQDEVQNIQEAFEKIGISNLCVVDASEEFFRNLQGVCDPEEKRRIVGNTFLAVQRRMSEEMGLRVEDGWMLGQGTIYPDTIETKGTKHADHIKTHHNRVEAIRMMIEAGLVIEPLKDLYKDEVRRLGEELGLPHDLVWRHPFPGPGLAVRILCGNNEELRIKNEELRIDLPYAALPLRSVGVQGDARTFRHALVLFPSTPVLQYSSTLWEELWQLATDIPNTYREFNRVLLCTSHAEPEPFILTPSWVTRERAELLRKADAVVESEIRQAGLYEAIWQFPVILLPVGLHAGGNSIVLRPVESTEAMTANAARLPVPILERMTQRLLTLPGIELVLYDMTSKPPATIEWE